MKNARDRRRALDRRELDLARLVRRERRVADRRALTVREISYEEWVAQAIARQNQRIEFAASTPRPAVTPRARRHRPRTVLDRRRIDYGPPAGRRERRRLTERRGLEVREITYAEFLKLLRPED